MLTSRRTILGIAVAVSLVACGGASSPPLTKATSLTCPQPGALPFRLASHGFENADSKTTARVDTRFKDEASDVIGNPGGVRASIYLADTDMPSATPVPFSGVKGRGDAGDGFSTTPLVGENVSLWHYDMATSAWSTLGRAVTDMNGGYSLPANGLEPAPGDPVYAMLEADGSCAQHYNYLLAPGTKVVVTDIDGTLTTSDNELVLELTDDTHVPAMVTAANTMTTTWAAKHYPVIYLSARMNLERAETRDWLSTENFAVGPVITQPTMAEASQYKTRWLQRMVTDFGWDIVAAYGNATTDISAYNNVNIPKDHTFIVGPFGGTDGTVAIPNLDFTDHIASFVDAQPSQ